MRIKDKKTWDEYVKLVASMAIDEMMGKGPTPRGFVSNLRGMASDMEALLEEPKFVTGSCPSCGNEFSYVEGSREECYDCNPFPSGGHK